MVNEQANINIDNIKEICSLLTTAEVNINVNAILASLDARSFDFADFTSHVNNEIQNTLYKSSYSNSLRIPEKFGNIIVEVLVNNDGKFSIKRVSDYLPEDDNKIASIQLGIRIQDYDTLILTSKRGTTYRLFYTFKRGWYSTENIHIEKVNLHLSMQYKAKQLNEIIKQILAPIIEYKHNLGDSTDEFMREEVTKLLPFNPHNWMTNKELSIVENWEYCINQGDWLFTRDSVLQIVNYIINNLSQYFENSQEYASWNRELSKVITNLKEL